MSFGMIVSGGGLVDGFTVLATMVIAIDDHNKPRECREEQKMEGKLNPSDVGRTIAVSERERARLEHRVAALESVVNFLMAEMREDQQRRIKSELERLRQYSPGVKASYDTWPDDPAMWQGLSRLRLGFPQQASARLLRSDRIVLSRWRSRTAAFYEIRSASK